MPVVEARTGPAVAAGGGGSGSGRCLMCSSNAGLAGAWLEEAQGSVVQAGQNHGSARGGRREMM